MCSIVLQMVFNAASPVHWHLLNTLVYFSKAPLLRGTSDIQQLFNKVVSIPLLAFVFLFLIQNPKHHSFEAELVGALP